MRVAKVAYVNDIPPGLLPANWCVSCLKALALPSNAIRSDH